MLGAPDPSLLKGAPENRAFIEGITGHISLTRKTFHLSMYFSEMPRDSVDQSSSACITNANAISFICRSEHPRCVSIK